DLQKSRVEKIKRFYGKLTKRFLIALHEEGADKFFFSTILQDAGCSEAGCMLEKIIKLCSYHLFSQ
uniref:Uncharacterized protein n=1 Tax=Ciona intestinalis TaxID=7719 RepID=H2XMS7_CIOIN